MGGYTLGTSGDVGSGTLVYTYCAKQSSAIVVTAVNLNSVPVPLTLLGMGGGKEISTEPRTEWVFTAPLGNLSSTTPVLNGGVEWVRLGEDGSPPALQGKEVPVGGGGIVLPPLSQAFFLLSAAGVPACTF